MLFSNVAVIGLEHVDAPHRLTSAAIEDKLMSVAEKYQMPPGLLENLSGIIARRVQKEGSMPSDAATAAAEKVFENTGFDRSKLGIVINSSVCRDYLEPSTACLVHGNLGLSENCINFDLSNACLGFINAMEYIGQLIERGAIEYGLVVDGEDARPVINNTIDRMLEPDCDVKEFRANYATLTLGSGGVAMLLGPKDKHPEGHSFTGMVTLAATEHNRLCVGTIEGMRTNTKELLIRGIELAAKTWAKAIETFGWSSDKVGEYVLHQVSKVHTEQLAAALGLDLEKVHRIYPEFGNVGPAGLPLTLSKSAELGRINEGDRVALLGIGSGLNCAMGEIIW